MSRRLVVINAALGVVAIVAAGYTIRELRTEAPTAVVRPASTPQPSSPPAADAPAPPPGGYASVAARNLFSPTRSEAPPSAVASGPALPKPQLYGIILREQAPVAYLEDPATKRVAGYRVGDAVAGGTVKTIANDHVVLNRPEGEVNVRLRDPSKPRPAAPPAAAAPGGTLPTIPGAPVPPGQGVAPPTVAAPGAPAVPPAGVQPLPQNPNALPPLPRRPLPPNLLRRLPPAGNDAPAQN
jgi:hypothetical protein